MKLSEYYFTFGTDERFPFRGGWVMIEAETLNQAQAIFKEHFPCRSENILNCADYYTEAQFKRTDMPVEGNLGMFCHKSIKGGADGYKK